MCTPEHMRCEVTENPLWIDTHAPRFSWALPPSFSTRWRQSGYQIEVYEKEGELVWDSKKVDDTRRYSIAYKGEMLCSFSCYRWRVRIFDAIQGWSLWSTWAFFETALLSPDEMKAHWISTPQPTWYLAGTWESGTPHQMTSKEEGMHTCGIYVTKEISLKKSANMIKRARAYVAGVGLYQLYINGKKVGNHFLSPAQSDYHAVVYYDVYTIEEYLAPQLQSITLFLGNGRHIPLYAFDKPQGFVQILIEYEDSREWICTDSTWVVSEGPIVQNSLFNGEVFDSRIPLSIPENAPYAQIVPPYPIQASHIPPVTIDCKLEAKRMWQTPEGFLFDFGQNFSGVAFLRGYQPYGTHVTLTYAENITEEGNLNPSSNRKAEATDTYIANGKPINWYPISTYHGFRYVLLSGYVGVPHIHTLQGLFIHTKTDEKGSFHCSCEELNRIHQAVLWGIRSNMMSIPTDSPQRDERHGWLGDALLIAPSVLLNYESQQFFEKFLQDIVDTQKEDGSITDVAPKFWMDKSADPAWGSAFISIAWYVYWYTGDTEILQRQYKNISSYCTYLLSQTHEGIVENLGTFGDWCAPGLVTSKKTGLPFISTWYLYHDLSLLVSIASILSKKDDLKWFEKEKKRIGKSLLDHYWKGSYMESLPMTPWDFPDQTSQALTLASDLLEEKELEKLAIYLDNVVSLTSGDHVGTGIHGTRYLLEQLSRWGRNEKAFTIATQHTYPGWFYMIREGATTLWERWEHITGEGMNSHNHIMFGSIDQWLYESVGGLFPLSSGWREIGCAPARYKKITFASVHMRTPYGEAHLDWRRVEENIYITLSIPSEAKGFLFLPPCVDESMIHFSHVPSINAVHSAIAIHPMRPYRNETHPHWELDPGWYEIEISC